MDVINTPTPILAQTPILAPPQLSQTENPAHLQSMDADELIARQLEEEDDEGRLCALVSDEISRCFDRQPDCATFTHKHAHVRAHSHAHAQAHIFTPTRAHVPPKGAAGSFNPSVGGSDLRPQGRPPAHNTELPPPPPSNERPQNTRESSSITSDLPAGWEAIDSGKVVYADRTTDGTTHPRARLT